MALFHTIGPRLGRMAIVCAAMFILSGCGGSSSTEGTSDLPELTPTATRAARRAYDGAPPVIPHDRIGNSCTECHTETGRMAPPIGFAPANPHHNTTSAGSMANCVQCHVFKSGDATFAAGNTFVGLSQSLEPADRLFEGAPPVIPHAVLLRENCNACHSAPSARPEIRCSHPERSNCRQCHMPQHPQASAVFEREL